MAVRPFYIEADIEGRQTMLSGGPRRNDGYMDTTIYQRNEGGIDTAFKIRSRAYDGKLVTEVIDHAGKTIAKYETKY